MKRRDERISDLVPQNEAAEEIGVSRQTLWQWARSGAIEAVNVGRSVLFRREDVERIKQERTTEE